MRAWEGRFVQVYGSQHQGTGGGGGGLQERRQQPRDLVGGRVGGAERERTHGVVENCWLFYSPCIQLPEKALRLKWRFIQLFKSYARKERPWDEGFLFPGFVYKEQSSRPMKSTVEPLL